MNDRWLSADEIAKHLGVGKNTIYRWINERGMPAHRVGRLWKFQQSEVDIWIRAGHASETEGAKEKPEDNDSSQVDGKRASKIGFPEKE